MLRPMRCPHCGTEFDDKWRQDSLSSTNEAPLRDEVGTWAVTSSVCSKCQGVVIDLLRAPSDAQSPERFRGWPPLTKRPVPPGVPDRLAQDFQEAAIVLPASPKASAALSRRCLEGLLRFQSGSETKHLNEAIDKLLATRNLPTHIAEAVDAVRHIGNFAAHPLKSTRTGEVLDVEAGEAEWLLDVLEALFDF